jgi:hypothetical protein
MACSSCGKTKKVDSQGRVIEPGAIEKGGMRSTGQSPASITGCLSKYGELKILDTKAVKLYNKLHHTDREKAKPFLDLNTRLRAWIVKLRFECPDERLLEEYKNFIEGEYAKHFQS